MSTGKKKKEIRRMPQKVNNRKSTNMYQRLTSGEKCKDLDSTENDTPFIGWEHGHLTLSREATAQLTKEKEPVKRYYVIGLVLD